MSLFARPELLHFLARHPGWVFTRYQIVNGVKGESYVVTERAVDVQIAGFRYHEINVSIVVRDSFDVGILAATLDFRCVKTGKDMRVCDE